MIESNETAATNTATPATVDEMIAEVSDLGIVFERYIEELEGALGGLSLEEALKHPMGVEFAYLYARDVIGDRFPEAEKLFAADPRLACGYAHDVLRGPFPAGEAAIATVGYLSFWYAFDVLRAPFPKGEKAIAADSYDMEQYSRLVLERA